MKSWSLKELEKNHSQWDQILGARLQKVIYHPKQILFLEWFLKGPFLMVIDLRKPNCFLALLPEMRPPKKVKKDAPVSLFIKSNFQDESLKLVELCSQYGRLLRFHFSEGKYLELRLYPKDINLIAVTPEKQVSHNRPKDLEEIEDDFIPEKYRELLLASREWWDEFQGKRENLSLKKDPEEQKKKELKKRQKQIKKLEEQKTKLKPKKWRELAEWINEHQSLDIPGEYKVLKWDLELKHWSQVVGFCFDKAKKEDLKLLGLLERLSEVENEISEIEEGKFSFDSGNAKKLDAQSDLQKKSGAKTKSKNIANDLRIHIGKSAKENVLLLRKAKPWFLWMHLKDLPGNHLIVEKNKNRELSEKELQLAAKELIASKASLTIGESFEVQFAECRYIKPIKGDKLGRVKVTQEKVLTVKA